jgi:hypothetical protein
MIGEGPIYVYGVVDSGASITLPRDGVASATPRLIESDGLAALVSSVPTARLRVRRADLHAHLRALEQVFDQTTVLPCRFGTVLPSEDDVRQHLLDARREELRGLLDRLAGSAQMNVKAAYDEPEVLRQLVASDPEVARARDRARKLGEAAYYENIRLGELVNAQLAARRAEDAERIYARVAPLAADAVVDTQAADALLVLKASFLVERKRLDHFDGELESLAKHEAPAIGFELVGPLPPTAFVALAQEA